MLAVRVCLASFMRSCPHLTIPGDWYFGLFQEKAYFFNFFFLHRIVQALSLRSMEQRQMIVLQASGPKRFFIPQWDAPSCTRDFVVSQL